MEIGREVAISYTISRDVAEQVGYSWQLSVTPTA
jgi:hypothetical protein